MTVQLVLVTSLEFVRSLVVCSKLKKVCEDLVQVSVHLLHFVRKRDRLFAEQTKFGTSLVHLLLLPSTPWAGLKVHERCCLLSDVQIPGSNFYSRHSATKHIFPVKSFSGTRVSFANEHCNLPIIKLTLAIAVTRNLADVHFARPAPD